MILLLGAGVLCPAAAERSAPCAGCHPKESSRYAMTAMGQSLIAPAARPDGHAAQEQSQATISSEERGGRMVHSVSEQGFSASYPVKYQMGGRMMGSTYMVQVGNTLFESPLSWFNSYGWDVSPGYAHKAPIDFDRPMDQACLFCHGGPVTFSDSDGRHLKNSQLTSITCERCHGPTEAHLRHPSSANIINPAKLSGSARNSVCEQCHLEGVTRTLNPGKTWSDFRAGERTEQTFSTYLLAKSSGAAVIAVSQTEQLAQSQCARKSEGRLWCGSCHDPHGAVVDRPRQIRAICTGCHARLAGAVHPAGSQVPAAECTGCHMPKHSTTDISHASLTDHRILRHPTAAPVADAGPSDGQEVAAWREPPSSMRERDLGLAEVVIGFSKGLQTIGEEGFRMLQTLPQQQVREDAPVLSALEGLFLQEQNTEEALRIGRQVVALQPQSAKAALNLGIVLKRSGNLTDAEQELARAIKLDPSLKEAYIELAMLYASQGQMAETADIVRQYRQWNPQDIMFRLQEARLSGK